MSLLIDYRIFISLISNLNTLLYCKMTKELIKFHLSCIDEYNLFLKKNNILFYGYGDKISLLEKMFPNAHIVVALPSKLYKSRINIIININLDKLNPDLLPKQGVICLLDTMNPTKINFTLNDLQKMNFLLKDLTTYQPYAENNKIGKSEQNITNLLNNLSKRSRNLFKLLVLKCEKNAIQMSELLKHTKKELLINDKKIIHQLLSEFVDHKIIKFKNERYFLRMKQENLLAYFNHENKLC